MKKSSLLIIFIFVMALSQIAAAQPDFIWHTVDTTFCRATNAAAADLDGDGDLDIIGASGRHGVHYWLNLGTFPPTYTEAHILNRNFSVGYEVKVADFDDDGDIDIISTGSIDDNNYICIVKIWENLYPNFFCHDLNTNSRIRRPLGIHDIDNDNDIDIIVNGLDNGNQILVYEYLANFEFSLHSCLLYTSPSPRD